MPCDRTLCSRAASYVRGGRTNGDSHQQEVSGSEQRALWVLRAQSGDREALEFLLRHIQPSLRRYLRGLVGPDDGDDVMQEVMLSIYRNLSWLEDPEVFRPWAFRIASRAGVRHLKRRKRWRTD